MLQARRKTTSEQKIEYLATLFTLLMVCDYYILEKKDNIIKLTVYKNVFKKEITGETEFDLSIPLGNWLTTLPKGIWDNS